MSFSSGNNDKNAGPETAREVFGRRVDRYAELNVFSEEQYYRPLLELADPQPGESALDLATGTGLLAQMIAASAARVVGADVTPEMLEKARDRVEAAGLENIEFVEAAVSDLPFPDGSFDLVTCRLAFHHFPVPGKALAEISRVLKTGGRFVMEDVYGPEDETVRKKREQLERRFDPSHVLAYTPAELSSLLQKGDFHVTSVLKPYTTGLPVDFILKLEKIEDPEDRAEIIRLLRADLDNDLGGFMATETDGELVLRWWTIIMAAVKS
ncbi:MAG: methyltransferase domain-containing protein [Actinobacteria bacterium]|nr:methyltransferase domain-containing protein [Actinomycetota bacterium]